MAHLNERYESFYLPIYAFMKLSLHEETFSDLYSVTHYTFYDSQLPSKWKGSLGDIVNEK